MITHYTEEELKGRKHLFVSYSHADGAIVQNAIDYLINEGVQIWYDIDLHNGENWIERARGVLTNENCIGVIFFNSKDSFISNAVDTEREIVLAKQAEWAKEGKSFVVYSVHVGSSSTMQLVKRALDSLPDDEKIIENTLGTPKLARIVQLFPQEMLYAGSEDYLSKLYSDINKGTKDAIDKNYVALDSVQEYIAEKGNSNITLKLGCWQGTPLVWHLFRCEDDDWFFLLDSILCKRVGGKPLIEWLNNEFMVTAFTQDERAVMEKPLRLLTLAEAQQTEFEYLAKDDQWWLADTNGMLQLTVRVNGTIYMNGHHNANNEKGVRPVLALKREPAQKLIKK